MDSVVGHSNVLVVLSADHGVMPLPEFLVQFRHQEARRILYPAQIKPKIDSIDRVIRKEWMIAEPIFETGGFLNYASAARAGKDSVQLERRVGEALRHIDGIADVYFRRELSEADRRPTVHTLRNSGGVITRPAEKIFKFGTVNIAWWSLIPPGPLMVQYTVMTPMCR